MEEGTFSPVHIGWGEALLRVGMAILVPLVLGMERYWRKKPIDFRPFVIVSVSACALALSAMEIAQRSYDNQLQIDPTRVFAGVITGIGFLGAGAMFREGGFVKGAGSAASILAAGAIGIVCGVGMIWLAAVVGLAILILLLLSEPLVNKYDPSTSESSSD